MSPLTPLIPITAPMRPASVRGTLWRFLRGLALAVVAGTVLANCSANPGADQRPTIAPATPALAPPQSALPAGRVVPAGAGAGLAFDGASRHLAAVTADEVVIYSVDPDLREAGRVKISGTIHQVIADGGSFLVAAAGGVYKLATEGTQPQWRAELAYPVDGEVLTVARPDNSSSGTTPAGPLVGTSDGRIISFGPSPTQRQTITGPVEASQLLSRNGKVAVVDRRQASITLVDIAAGTVGESLRVGRGITNAAIDPFGRIFAIDTGAHQVIGYTIDPFMERFLYPAPSVPWAVDYDASAKLMWVTQTAANQVVGYTLGSGIPEQARNYPTVRGPNAIAVDAATGRLYVQSATGDGIQVISTK